MGIIAAALALFAIIGFALATNGNSKKAQGGQMSEDKHWKRIESIHMQDASNNELYEKLINVFKSGEPMNDNTLYSKEEMKQLGDRISNVTNEHDADFLTVMRFELSVNRGTPTGRDDVKGVQLNPREQCYFSTKNSICNTVERLQRNVTYSGFRTNMGGYRVGNFSVNSNDLEGFKVFDGGSLYITNQRIIFVGLNNKNKVIPIGKILNYTTYEQTGILINIENSKPIIFNLGCTGMFDITDSGIILFNDDKYAFLYALDYVLESRK